MTNVSSHQKKILDLGVSVARAISGELSLNYRGERLYNGNSPCYYQSAHTNDLTFISRHELTNSKLSMQNYIVALPGTHSLTYKSLISHFAL